MSSSLSLSSSSSSWSWWSSSQWQGTRLFYPDGLVFFCWAPVCFPYYQSYAGMPSFIIIWSSYHHGSIYHDIIVSSYCHVLVLLSILSSICHHTFSQSDDQRHSISLFSLTLRDLPDFSDPQAVSIFYQSSNIIVSFVFFLLSQPILCLVFVLENFLWYLREEKIERWLDCLCKNFGPGRRAVHIDIVDDTGKRKENWENKLCQGQVGSCFVIALSFLRDIALVSYSWDQIIKKGRFTHDSSCWPVSHYNLVWQIIVLGGYHAV